MLSQTHASLPTVLSARRLASITSAHALCDSEPWASSWWVGRAMTLEQAFREAFVQD